MSEKISALLERVAAHTVPVVRGIADDQLGSPTPCSEYDVRALTGHLYRVVKDFQHLAAKRGEEVALQQPPLELAGDWRADFAREAERLVAAWAQPGAEEGTTGSMGMPATTVGLMVAGDLVLHGWDLARATGQPYVQDDDVLRVLGECFGELAPMARSFGVFADPVEVGADAGPLDALLGVTGRDPHWTRP